MTQCQDAQEEEVTSQQ